MYEIFKWNENEMFFSTKKTRILYIFILSIGMVCFVNTRVIDNLLGCRYNELALNVITARPIAYIS